LDGQDTQPDAEASQKMNLVGGGLASRTRRSRRTGQGMRYRARVGEFYLEFG